MTTAGPTSLPPTRPTRPNRGRRLRWLVAVVLVIAAAVGVRALTRPKTWDTAATEPVASGRETLVGTLCFSVVENTSAPGTAIEPGVYAIDLGTSVRRKVLDRIPESIRLSPDSTMLAYQDAKFVVHVRYRDGTDRLIEGMNGPPVWSRDGEELIATAASQISDTKWKCVSRRARLDGTGMTQLPLPETDIVEDWSPDKNWLLVTTDPTGKGENYQLHCVRLDGSERTVLGKTGRHFCPRFSGTGHEVSFLRQVNGVTILFVTDVRATRLTEVYRIPRGAPNAAANWVDKGRRLLLLSGEEIVAIDPTTGGRFPLNLPRFSYGLVDCQ